MASLQPTEDWRMRSHKPRVSAARGFLAPGYSTSQAAIAAVIGNFGVRPGAVHPDDPYMFVTMDGLEARNQDGPTTWIVTVAYAYLASTYSAGQDAEPLLRPTRWLIQPGLDSINIDMDVYGNPIANSAGVPFEPKRTDMIRTLFIRATRFYSNYAIGTALKYMNKTNASPVTIKSLGIVPAGCLKCNLIAPTQEIVLDQPQPIEVVHEFEVRGEIVTGDNLDPGFALAEIDKGSAGWYYKNNIAYQGDFSTPDPADSTQYINRTSEVLLDGTGAPLPQEITAGVRIGTGNSSSVNTPNRAPQGKELPITVQRRPTDKAIRLLFTVKKSIDFGPLIAGL